MERKCSNCKHRYYGSWIGMDVCAGYEIAEDEAAEIEQAKICNRYEEGKPPCLEDDEHTPSATNGDYSPSCPWNAPGMSISDFI